MELSPEEEEIVHTRLQGREASEQLLVAELHAAERSQLQQMAQDLQTLAQVQETVNEQLALQQTPLDLSEQAIQNSEASLSEGLHQHAAAMKHKAGQYTSGGLGTGAVLGAAIGVVGGPVGMAIGAGLGAVVGGALGRQVTSSMRNSIDREVNAFEQRHRPNAAGPIADSPLPSSSSSSTSRENAARGPAGPAAEADWVHDSLRPAAEANWVHDSLVSCCMLCGANFTFLRRKHHCRLCGRVVCDSCSLHRVWPPPPAEEAEQPLHYSPELGSVGEAEDAKAGAAAGAGSKVRCCNTCFLERRQTTTAAGEVDWAAMVRPKPLLDHGEQTYTQVVFESQRRTAGLSGSEWQAPWLPGDPPAVCWQWLDQDTHAPPDHDTAHDKKVMSAVERAEIDAKLPLGWRWCGPWNVAVSDATDNNGWSYAFSFGSSPASWTAQPSATCFVRQRAWVRMRARYSIKRQNRASVRRRRRARAGDGQCGPDGSPQAAGPAGQDDWPAAAAEEDKESEEEQAVRAAYQLQAVVQQGSQTMVTQGGQIRAMDRTLKKEQDLLHVNRRVRNAASLTGRLRNAFVQSASPGCAATPPSQLARPPTDGPAGPRLSLAQQGDATAEIASVVQQVRGEVIDHSQELSVQNQLLHDISRKADANNKTTQQQIRRMDRDRRRFL
eukprot:g30542.t1